MFEKKKENHNRNTRKTISCSVCVCVCVCVADRHQLSDLLIIINYLLSRECVEQTNKKKNKSKLSISFFFRWFIPIITVINKPSAQEEEEVEKRERCVYIRTGYGREDLIDWIRGISLIIVEFSHVWVAAKVGLISDRSCKTASFHLSGTIYKYVYLDSIGCLFGVGNDVTSPNIHVSVWYAAATLCVAHITEAVGCC